MNTLRCLVPGCLAILLTAPLQAQGNEIYSLALGFTKHTITSGNNPYAPGLVHEDGISMLMAGISESGTETTITLPQGVTVNAGDFAPNALYPTHYVEITDDSDPAKQGYVFDVISNTTTEVVVNGKMTTVFNLAGTEQIVIRKHMTVSDIFEGATGLTAYGHSVKFFNEDNTSTTLIWDGSVWTPDLSTDHSTRPVYPGSGFLTIFDTNVDLKITGEVKSTPTKVPAYVNSINMVSALSPVDTTVGELNLLPTLSVIQDFIKVFEHDGTLGSSTTYLSTGTFMSNDLVTDHGTDPIFDRDAFILGVDSDKYWTVPAAYTPPAP